MFSVKDCRFRKEKHETLPDLCSPLEATLAAAASIIHPNLGLNCQRVMCIVGNVNPLEEYVGKKRDDVFAFAALILILSFQMIHRKINVTGAK